MVSISARLRRRTFSTALLFSFSSAESSSFILSWFLIACTLLVLEMDFSPFLVYRIIGRLTLMLLTICTGVAFISFGCGLDSAFLLFYKER